MFMDIGQGKAYEARREFEERIRERANRDEIEMTAMVKAVDPSSEDEKHSMVDSTRWCIGSEEI